MPDPKKHPLQIYFDQQNITHGQFAPRIPVSPSMVSHWITGRCRITGEHAKRIEEETSGMVPRHKLRPDLFDPPAHQQALMQ